MSRHPLLAKDLASKSCPAFRCRSCSCLELDHTHRTLSAASLQRTLPLAIRHSGALDSSSRLVNRCASIPSWSPTPTWMVANKFDTLCRMYAQLLCHVKTAGGKFDESLSRCLRKTSHSPLQANANHPHDVFSTCSQLVGCSTVHVQTATQKEKILLVILLYKGLHLCELWVGSGGHCCLKHSHSWPVPIISSSAVTSRSQPRDQSSDLDRDSFSLWTAACADVSTLLLCCINFCCMSSTCAFVLVMVFSSSSTALRKLAYARCNYPCVSRDSKLSCRTPAHSVRADTISAANV